MSNPTEHRAKWLELVVTALAGRSQADKDRILDVAYAQIDPARVTFSVPNREDLLAIVAEAEAERSRQFRRKLYGLLWLSCETHTDEALESIWPVIQDELEWQRKR